MQEIVAEEHIQKYFAGIRERTGKQLQTAEKAKKKGIDASEEVETLQATDLAERTETIVGPKGVAERYRELSKKEKDRIKVIFQIFKEILEERWVEIPSEEKRLEQAIKTCLMLNTEGVVVAPVDGVPEVKISKNFDGTKYVDIYFAGPIRAAGGTSTVLPLILGDYARKLLSLYRYKPTKDEVERYIEETQLYEQIVSRQYRVKAEEVRKIIEGCPVCINGEPTEKKEVAVHRDLERIPSNRIRGGACLVISEGVALKARKILMFANMLKLDWSWLENIIKFEKHEEKREIDANYKYLDGLAVGRPIFCYPSQAGGFRLRYGRSRGGGIMGKSIHPVTMHLLDGFPAIGTQLKIERPGKAAGILACDTIECPAVLLKDKSVKKLNSLKEFKECEGKIEKILFLGDILVSYGDFKHSAHPLVPAGYCEEWYRQEIRAIGNKELIKEVEGRKTERRELVKEVEGEKRGNEVEGEKRGNKELKKEANGEITGKKAIELSEKYNIPLHPAFMRFYSLLEKEEAIELIKAVQNAEIEKKEGQIVKALLENTEKIKSLLEKILLEHYLEGKKIVITGEIAYPFLKVFGAFEKLNLKALEKKEDSLSVLRKVSGIKLRNKAGTFIGARMGRPESSSPRKMKGNPQVLFPIGNYGGSIRSINKAAEKKLVEVETALLRCGKCNKTTHKVFCPECSTRTEIIKQCIKCGKETLQEECSYCGEKTRGFTTRKIDLEQELMLAAEKLKIKTPKLVKGIRGMISENKIAEPLEKGLLRSKHELHIFRDGTIRYELINNSLTHFKPKEINTGIEKLKELGYERDAEGKELKSEEQIVELLPQDIIVHEEAGDFFVRVSQFVDEELERLYGMEKFYGIEDKEELIGELVLGLAPHTSAAIVGRIIGYTEARGCFAHPYFHQAKRRNCVHPETELIVYNEETKKDEKRKIEEIVEKAIHESPMKSEFFTNYSIENKQALYVYALNQRTFKLEKKQIKYFLKNPVPEHWVRIRTSSNKELVMTPEHKFAFINMEKKLELKDGEDVKVEDRILVKSADTKGEGEKIGDCVIEEIESVEKIKDDKPAYCIEIEGENTLEKIVLWGNNILQPRCDGEQDSLTLLMDALLNFSQAYLPASRGGRMDAPLVFTNALNPNEIDDEVHKLESCKEYPLELYEKALEFASPEIAEIETIAERLGKKEQYSGLKYSHETSDFAAGPKYSKYVQLKTMKEKMELQAELQERISAVETNDSIERVLASHLLPDCIGNVRSFSKQKFRCTNCNTKYRRIPLNGKCSSCKGGNIILTIAHGSVIKYLEIAKEIVKKYELREYLKQRIDLVEKEIKSIFENKKEEQKSLSEFM